MAHLIQARLFATAKIEQKIPAIKAIRQATKYGLRESKDLVELIIDRYQENDRFAQGVTVTVTPAQFGNLVAMMDLDGCSIVAQPLALLQISEFDLSVSIRF